MKHHCQFIEKGTGRDIYTADLPRVPNIDEGVFINFASRAHYRVVEVHTHLIPGCVEVTYTIVVRTT